MKTLRAIVIVVFGLLFGRILLHCFQVWDEFKPKGNPFKNNFT